jgi:hypothetical protein
MDVDREMEQYNLGLTFYLRAFPSFSYLLHSRYTCPARAQHNYINNLIPVFALITCNPNSII